VPVAAVAPVNICKPLGPFGIYPDVFSVWP